MRILAFSERLEQDGDAPVVCGDLQVRLVKVGPNEDASWRCREDALERTLTLSVPDVLEVRSRARESPDAGDVGVPVRSDAPVVENDSKFGVHRTQSHRAQDGAQDLVALAAVEPQLSEEVLLIFIKKPAGQVAADDRVSRAR